MNTNTQQPIQDVLESIAAHRALVNRNNAQKSTGPKTEKGKQRVSLNALRHGLTGHAVVLPQEDFDAYNKHSRRFQDELKPVGIFEEEVALTISDTYWRLNRLRAMENTIFALAANEGRVYSSDESFQAMLGQAMSLKDNADLLAKFSLYESRLNRTLEKAKIELKQLQESRKQAEQEALRLALRISNFKKAMNQQWQPKDDGFEFSNERIAEYARFETVKRDADIYHYHRRLPKNPPQEAPNS